MPPTRSSKKTEGCSRGSQQEVKKVVAYLRTNDCRGQKRKEGSGYPVEELRDRKRYPDSTMKHPVEGRWAQAER